MDFSRRIKEGSEGKYQGLDNGLGSINDHIYYVQRKWYYLLGGLSNSGKTTLADFMVLNAIRDANENDIPITVFYFSYEIDRETKMAQWLSNHIFSKYGIEIGAEKIAQLGDYRLDESELEVVERELPYIQKLFDSIRFTFDTTNPTGVYKELFRYYDENGTFSYEDYETIDDTGRTALDRRITGYTSNNPNEYVIVVVDHIALSKIERKYSLKENIDKLSEYAVRLKNMCGTTFIMLQQFNQGMHSVDRKKYNGEELVPQQSDFKDSGNPYQDCDTAIGIMNPLAMGLSSNNIFKYNFRRMKSKFRIVNIIKNRKGKTGVVYGYYFNPKTGCFKILPDPDLMSEEVYKKIENDQYW